MREAARIIPLPDHRPRVVPFPRGPAHVEPQRRRRDVHAESVGHDRPDVGQIARRAAVGRGGVVLRQSQGGVDVEYRVDLGQYVLDLLWRGIARAAARARRPSSRAVLGLGWGRQALLAADQVVVLTEVAVPDLGVGQVVPRGEGGELGRYLGASLGVVLLLLGLGLLLFLLGILLGLGRAGRRGCRGLEISYYLDPRRVENRFERVFDGRSKGSEPK